MSYAEKLAITNPAVKYKSSKEDKIGGEGGIRTHVPLRATAFRVRLVMTTSILLQIRFANRYTPFTNHRNIISYSLFHINRNNEAESLLTDFNIYTLSAGKLAIYADAKVLCSLWF